MNSIYNLQFDYIQSNGNYLILSQKEGLKRSDLTELQVKMLQNNQIPGLLLMEIEEVDLICRLRYNLIAKKPLTSLLNGRPLKKNEFFQLILNVVNILNDSKLYMLSEQSYLLNFDYIFCGRELNDIYLIYLPLKDLEHKPSIASELKNLILKLSVPSNSSEEKAIAELLALVNEQYFSIPTFRQQLITLIKEQNQDSVLARIPDIKLSNQQGNKRLTASKGRLKPLTSRQKTYLFAASILLSAVIWRYYQDYPSEATLYISLGLTLLVADIDLVLLKVWRPNKAAKEKIHPDKPHISPVTPLESSVGLNKNHYQLLPGNTMILSSNDETVYLDRELAATSEQPIMAKAILIVKRGEATEKITIDRTSFIIGRNSLQVAYVENTRGMSREHFEIKSLISGFMLRDLGSKNGTRLNAQAITPHKLYPLKDGDIIRAAKVEYLFMAE